jgi:hypothetical protein
VAAQRTGIDVYGCGAAAQVLSGLFSAVVPDALQLVRKKLRETVATTNHNLVMSCFNLMDAMLKPYVGKEGEPATHRG